MHVELERLLGGRVDLVDLTHAPPLLQMEIARHGVVLFDATGSEHPSFVSLAVRRSEDTRKRRKKTQDPRAAFHVAVIELERVRDLPLAEYRKDLWRKKAIERFLQEAIDAAVDCAVHLLARAGRPALPDTYSSFAALAALGVIDDALASALAPATGLRNRLVHEYDAIDDAKVHASVGFAITQLPRFIAQVTRGCARRRARADLFGRVEREQRFNIFGCEAGAVQRLYASRLAGASPLQARLRSLELSFTGSGRFSQRSASPSQARCGRRGRRAGRRRGR